MASTTHRLPKEPITTVEAPYVSSMVISDEMMLTNLGTYGIFSERISQSKYHNTAMQLQEMAWL